MTLICIDLTQGVENLAICFICFACSSLSRNFKKFRLFEKIWSRERL